MSCNSQPSMPLSSLFSSFLTLSLLSLETSSNTRRYVQITTVPKVAEKYTGLQMCSFIVKYQVLLQHPPNWTFIIANFVACTTVLFMYLSNVRSWKTIHCVFWNIIMLWNCNDTQLFFIKFPSYCAQSLPEAQVIQMDTSYIPIYSEHIES